MYLLILPCFNSYQAWPILFSLFFPYFLPIILSRLQTTYHFHEFLHFSCKGLAIVTLKLSFSRTSPSFNHPGAKSQLTKRESMSTLCSRPRRTFNNQSSLEFVIISLFLQPIAFLFRSGEENRFLLSLKPSVSSYLPILSPRTICSLGLLDPRDVAPLWGCSREYWRSPAFFLEAPFSIF